MDIVIAAEKPTIADLLSERLRCPVNVQDISVRPNPEETGSFLIRWRLNRYLLSPDGRLALRAIRGDGCRRSPVRLPQVPEPLRNAPTSSC